MDSPVTALLIAFGLLCLNTWIKYLRICKSCKLEELRDRHSEERSATSVVSWRWPERKVGPEGRTHLGRRV